VQNAAAVEGREEVLATRLDGLQHAAVERLREPVGRLVTRAARSQPVADERREAQRRDLERVALGQG
jgi:hypothetical protein